MVHPQPSLQHLPHSQHLWRREEGRRRGGRQGKGRVRREHEGATHTH